MKKLALGIMFFMFIWFLAYATARAADVIFHNANQFTLNWDLVTTDLDGDPLTGVTYEVWMANALTDPTKTNPAIVAQPTTNSAVITIGVKGRYFVGVRSVWDGLYSEINWGDLPDLQTVPVFGVRFAVPPKVPDGLSK